MVLAIWLIFAVTYYGLAVGRWPGLRCDRSAISLVGAAAMLAIGALPFAEAMQAIDHETIALLVGMMVVVAVLKISGFFQLITDRWLVKIQSGPLLLAVVIGTSGLLSAFLINDVVCVALTPLVLHSCQRLKRPPIPYLVGLATAANIGSVATITGNPQNLIIGSLSQIAYGTFFARLAPIALVGLAIDFGVVWFVYRKSLQMLAAPPEPQAASELVYKKRRPLLIKSLVITLGTVAAFFSGAPIAVVALVAASLLLLDRISPRKIYGEVDGPLLLMFCGLFIVVHAFDKHVVSTWPLAQWPALQQSPVVLTSLLSVALSNLVSNVPAVLLFKPVIAVIQDKQTAWLALAMSSTLAGNLTLLGSVANLIVVENAKRAGIRLGFGEYLKVGIPVTVLTTALGIAWMTFSR